MPRLGLPRLCSHADVDAPLHQHNIFSIVPGLQRIASKLGIDCAAAIVGFEYSTNGWSYPVKDGFVVCEEHKDILLDAYNQVFQFNFKIFNQIRLLAA